MVTTGIVYKFVAFQCSYSKPEIVLNVLNALIPLIFITTVSSRYHYYIHLTTKKTDYTAKKCKNEEFQQ